MNKIVIYIKTAAVAHIAVAVVLFFAAACGGGPGQRIKDIEAQKSSPTPTPGEREISGVFNITGADTNGNDEYKGVLTVAPQGDVYGFRWSTTKGSRAGTGVQLGNSTAVSYAVTGGGKGCGVILYKVDTINGILDGRSTLWGENKFGTEKAIRVEGTGFPGTYKITGTGIDGNNYSATLAITKDGSGYDFQWIRSEGAHAMPRLVAFGIWNGSVAAASFGGPQCSFVLYDISSNGNMEGNWGGQKSVTFGTEAAKRQ